MVKISGSEFSYTFYLMATGRKKRKKVTFYLEEEYLEILRKNGYMNSISDLLNYLVELFLRKEGLFNPPDLKIEI
jgi:hypothetical protein